MGLITRWRSFAGSAGLALAFAAAVAAGAFAIVTGLTPAATTPPQPREALLIERAPAPAIPEARPPVPEPAPASAAPDPEARAAPDPATGPPARPAGPPRRTPPRVDMAALPSEPPQLPAPLRRAAPDPPRLTPAPILRPRADPRLEGVLTPDEVRRIRNALRLTPEQTPHWPPVEALLQEIGAQQLALVKAGQKAEAAFDSGVSMRIYWAARPLLGVLREDQKARIRARARALGLEAVASAI